MKGILAAALVCAMGPLALAQEIVTEPYGYGYSTGGGVRDPLFAYDDVEPWKHGWIQVMPYYPGYHSFRPYNYKAVFSQSQTAAGWGMPIGTGYSQQFWHHYAPMVDLEQQTDVGRDHPSQRPYPAPQQGYGRPSYQGPSSPAPSYQGPTYAEPISHQSHSPQSQWTPPRSFAPQQTQTPIQQHLNSPPVPAYGPHLGY